MAADKLVNVGFVVNSDNPGSSVRRNSVRTIRGKVVLLSAVAL